MCSSPAASAWPYSQSLGLVPAGAASMRRPRPMPMPMLMPDGGGGGRGEGLGAAWRWVQDCGHHRDRERGHLG